MIHPCAACQLRFVSTGELADHIRSEHLQHLDQPVEPHGSAAHHHLKLASDHFSRSGWARPDAPAD